jgi:Domain of unknown function (DUF4396)
MPWDGQWRPNAPAIKGERPYWKQTFLSATHCGSGCVIGDVLAPLIVFGFGLTLLGSVHFAEYVAEFVLAYAFGIAFQYFPIRSMRDVIAIETALPFPMVMALQHVLGRYRGQYASGDPHLKRPCCA